MSQHLRLVKVLRKAYQDKPHPVAVVIDDQDDMGLIRLLFKNYRGGNEGENKGLSLTEGGLAIIQLYFKSYRIPMPENYVTQSKHLLYMDRVTTMPWHLDRQFLTLFEPDLAMMAKLAGDIDALMEVFDIKG